jgi:cyclophilin family peptidyl-prolyl cis-trans isomerase
MAINPDSIPSSEQVRETFVDRIYYPYQKQIFVVAAVCGVAVLAVLGIRWKQELRKEEMWGRFYRLEEMETSTPDAARERVASLEALIRDYPEDSVTPHAMRAIVFAHEAAGEWDEARAALDSLAGKYGDYDLFRVPSDPENAASRTIADGHELLIKKEIDWKSSSTYTHPKPDESRLALIETSKGNLWIAFYPDLAPAHVASFVAHAKAGDLNRTQFFEVRKSTQDEPQLLLAGSAASKDWTNPMEHDRDEPTAVIEPEPSRFRVRHQFGVVSAVKMPSGESGMAFMIVTAKNGFRRYDGDSSPFGMVIDREGSLATLAALAESPTYGTNPETKDLNGILSVQAHPYPYVYVRRVTVYSEERLEDGHTWDTSRSSQPLPELWESDLPAAWKPDPTKILPPEELNPDGTPKTPVKSPKDPDDGGDDPDESGGDDAGDDAPR